MATAVSRLCIRLLLMDGLMAVQTIGVHSLSRMCRKYVVENFVPVSLTPSFLSVKPALLRLVSVNRSAFFVDVGNVFTALCAGSGRGQH